MMDANDDRMFGLADDELDRRFAEAVRLANEAKIAMGVPLPMFDFDAKRAYLLHPDGRKEYVNAS
ncbi:MAG: hypothetical protein IKG18_15495 [Atopobiaceae bacterium]|nr:hypothetical protein [Atopobiaceae bacterium]MBR3315532.1 hypothetical protein [Atopobiaceae bacterium]